MGTTFFGQASEKGQMLTKTVFPPQNEPYRAKLSFSSVLKHFH